MPLSHPVEANPLCLTGGPATGKSRVANWLQARRWRVVCSDEIVHQFYEPGQAMASRIGREFGSEMLTAGGRVNRLKLGELVFRDTTARERLNALVHPAVRGEWRRRMKKSLAGGRRVVVVIPLAYETGVVSEFGQTWVVACSKAEQMARLRGRGFGPEQIETRLASQWPLQKKMDLADVVLWNDGAWKLTTGQLRSLRP